MREFEKSNIENYLVINVLFPLDCISNDEILQNSGHWTILVLNKHPIYLQGYQGGIFNMFLRSFSVTIHAHGSSGGHMTSIQLRHSCSHGIYSP